MKLKDFRLLSCMSLSELKITEREVQRPQKRGINAIEESYSKFKRHVPVETRLATAQYILNHRNYVRYSSKKEHHRSNVHMIQDFASMAKKKYFFSSDNLNPRNFIFKIEKRCCKFNFFKKSSSSSLHYLNILWHINRQLRIYMPNIKPGLQILY